MALKVVLMLALAAVVRAQLPGLGSCPDVPPVRDFKMDQFLGNWFEYERYLTSVFEVGTICSRINYSKTDDGRYHAANSLTTRLTGVTRVISGDMKLADPGKLSIRYEQLPVAINSVYSVVATDYDNYAILWSCNTAVPFLITSQNAWLMTRVREPDQKILDQARTEYERLGISRRFISKVDHSLASCPEEAGAAAATAPVVAPAVRNQQVHLKPEINAVEVEKKKVVPEVVKDAEVAPAVAPVVAAVVPVDAPIVDAVKSEPEEQATPEPEPEPTPAEAEPTIKPIPDTDTVKAEKVESIVEPQKIVEEKKE